MAWDQERPALGTKVKTADDNFRANWAAFEDAAEQEHVFDGDGSADEGQHRPGMMGVMKVGPTSAVSSYGLSAEGGPLVEGPGAIIYDSQAKTFMTWGGSSWTHWRLAAASAATVSQTWTVGGAYIDGRDPSVDGAKIDTCSTSADDITVTHGTAAHGASMEKPDGYSIQESVVFCHNCGVWDLGNYYVRSIGCSATEVVDSGSTIGWKFHSQLIDTDNETHNPTIYFMVVSRRRNS